MYFLVYKYQSSHQPSHNRTHGFYDTPEVAWSVLEENERPFFYVAKAIPLTPVVTTVWKETK